MRFVTSTSRVVLPGSDREGRSMIYAARFETMNELLGYLTDNCCQGAPEKCAPSRQCAPSKTNKRKSETV